jgi:sugar lactone lactonase YvrE
MDPFLSIWWVTANLFVAYGLWWLCTSKRLSAFGPFAAAALTASIIAAGVIDLAPIRNNSYVEMNYHNDDLLKWLNKNTKPHDVFLTDRDHSGPILLGGRRIFLGPYSVAAGCDTSERESIYRQIFGSKSPARAIRLLNENHIDYVAIDDDIRQRKLIRDTNEYFYLRYFQKVYDDKENRYHKLAIYKVPASASVNLVALELSQPRVNVFQGGKGTGEGEFENPRGLALDSAGNIFVADTDNARIEKFSPNGTYISTIGTKGGYGQLGQPNGLAVDGAGNIYIADVSTHSVRKLTPDGTPIAQWAAALYGPRRIVIGPDNAIYLVDQGHNRIVKFDVNGDVLTTWGSSGNGDGQFQDPSSVAVDPTSNKVYVADPINKRIQVFDPDGHFLTKWPVPEWGERSGFEDLAIDAGKGRLYASSANLNVILIFDLQGNTLGRLAATPPDKLDAPSAIALRKNKLFVLNTASARVSVIDLRNR